MISWKTRLFVILVILIAALGSANLALAGRGDQEESTTTEEDGGQPPFRVSGVVTAINGDGLTVEQEDGTKVTIGLSEETLYIRAASAEGEITVDDIQIGDTVAISAASEGESANSVILLPTLTLSADPKADAPKAPIVPPAACKAQIDGAATIYNSPQQAVDAASNGALIKVAGYCVGVFFREEITQSIYADLDLTFRGGYEGTFTQPPDPAMYPTVIDADYEGRVLVVTDTSTVRVEDMTLIKGNSWLLFGNKVDSLLQAGVGGGAYVVDGSSLTIVDSTLDWNGAPGDGGGIYAYGSTVNLLNSTVQNNFAYWPGAGIDPAGGGIYINGTLTISGTDVVSNTSDGYGGGIFADGPNTVVTVDNSQVSYNYAYWNGGGFDIHDETELTINNSQVNYNYSDDGDGGAMNADGTPEITINNSQLNYNVVEDSDGGVLNAGFPNEDDDITATINNSQLDHNYAYSEGTIWISGTLTINNSTLNYNTTGSEGGAAIYTTGPNTEVTINDSQLNYNLAQSDGGALNLNDGGTTEINDSTLDYNKSWDDGGAVDIWESTLIVNNSSLSYNYADNSGGAIDFSGYSTVTINDSVLNYNYTKGSGGGIDVGSSDVLTVNNSDISYNQAPDTSDNGGGINNYEGTVYIANSTLSYNLTGGSGGGINNGMWPAHLSLLNTTISDNTAYGYGGGGIANYSGATTLMINTTIANNILNAGFSGGGILNAGFNTINATLKVSNTIVADNAIDNCFMGSGGYSESYGNNISSDDCDFFDDGDDLNDVAVNLGPLQNNGGPTSTRRPLIGSPAIDIESTPCLLATDQRGISRPLDGDANNVAACDSGAVEVDLVRLSITKSVSDDTPGTGPITYTITVANAGPQAATNILVQDTLPVSLTYVLSDATQGDYDPQTGFWGVGNLASGASATLEIVADVPLGTGGLTLVNTADILYVDQEDDTSNNSASATITIADADLAVSKWVDDETPAYGQQITYTVTVYNDGPEDAADVILSDTLPEKLTFVSANTTQGVYTEATGIWSIGTLAVSETVTMTLVAEVTGGTPNPIINWASVWATDVNDSDASNNNASATIWVGGFMVEPDSLEVTLGKNLAATREMTITNINGSYLTWTLEETPTADWLTESATTGAISQTGSATDQSNVEVTFSSAGLDEGVYQTTLQVTGSTGGDPVDVPVTLIVKQTWIYVPIILKPEAITTTSVAGQ
jgi:uncharacterized repeat protein (TIGR01451 family)